MELINIELTWHVSGMATQFPRCIAYPFMHSEHTSPGQLWHLDTEQAKVVKISNFENNSPNNF